DLSYTYDPVGNITETRDNAQQTIFFKNAVVSPGTQYVYDALYWLTLSTGRGHIGQTGTPPPNYAPEYDYNDVFRINLPHPNDGKAMQNYTEQYQYDSVGNITSMAHQAAGNTWTRRYAHTPDSNRLQSTSLPGDAPTGPFSALYSYDIHGDMTKMHHLPQMQWDFKNQLHQVDLGGGGTAYYVYDASGQRIRKVVESGSLTKERIYLGGYEIFRQRNGSGLTRERETLHIMDDKQRIALVETQTIDGGNPVASPTSLFRYQLGNHLSSAVLELDAAGAIISYEEYYPYGSTSYQAGRSATEVSLKRYRYTGKERDEETGLYYHGARYYASWLGRWVSCDPKGMADETNLYVYVLNNPAKYNDPQGTAANDPTITPLSKSTSDESVVQKIVAAASSAGHAVTEGAIWNPTISGVLSKAEQLAINARRGVILEKLAGNNLGRYTALADKVTATTVTQIKSTSITSVRKIAQLVRNATRDAAEFIRQNPTQAGKAAQAQIILKSTAKKEVVQAAEDALAGVRKPITNAIAPKVTKGLPGVVGVIGKGATVVGGAYSAYSLYQDVAKRDVTAGVGDAASTASSGLTIAGWATETAGLGTAGAVTGSFAAGYAVGRTIDKGVELATEKVFSKDYSPSTLLSRGLSAADRQISKWWVDPSKPAETQTLAWKLVKWLDK
ncbi:MAG: RHS repeat-associated core domain-containing protein, partial [Ktedonobacteraceae bacterium]